MRTLIIAEAGVNHNGSLEIAKELCLAAKEAGADVVKFQNWKTDKIITKDVKQADYQSANTGNVETQYDMLKRLELSYEDTRIVKEYCDEIGITFASTADEIDSLDFLIGLGIPFVKIGSGDIGNVSYLREIGKRKLPIILSTGMSSLSDVELSINALRQGGATDIRLMHCTTSYPCPYDKVNLNAMDTMRAAFGLDVGYSDHTLGVGIPIAAVAKGASIIEKHFTLDCNMEGPDHLASTEPKEFKLMVDSIRSVEQGLGSARKSPSDEEVKISKVVLKRIVAKTSIAKGDLFCEENIAVKRSTNGFDAKNWDLIIGRVAHRDFSPDEAIEI